MREFELIKLDIYLLLTLNSTIKCKKKQIFFYEIYTPIFEKKKVLPANRRSMFQLLDALRLNDKGIINSYETTEKTHATMNAKIALPLYGTFAFVDIKMRLTSYKNKSPLYF